VPLTATFIWVGGYLDDALLPLKIIFQKKKTEKKESHFNKADKRKNQKETE